MPVVFECAALAGLVLVVGRWSKVAMVQASASRILFLFSKRDPGNSPEHSNFLYLYGNHWCRVLRETDKMPHLAAHRYDLYEKSRAALLALSDVLPVALIDASGDKSEVRHAIGAALSAHECTWNLREV